MVIQDKKYFPTNLDRLVITKNAALKKDGEEDGDGIKKKGQYMPSSDYDLLPMQWYQPGTTPDSWLIPKAYKETIRWAKEFCNDPYVSRIIKLKALYPLSRFKLTGIEDTSIIRFYEDMIHNSRFEIDEFLQEMALSWRRQGEVIGAGLLKERIMSTSTQQKWVWDKMVLYDSEYVDVSKSVVDDMPVISIELTPETVKELRRILESDDPEDQEKAKSIDDHLKKAVEGKKKKDRLLTLDIVGVNEGDEEYQPPEGFYMANHYTIGERGFPEVMHVVKDLMKRDRLNRAQVTLADKCCITGDVKIPLLNGTVKTVKELFDNKVKSFWVYSIDRCGNIVPGLCEGVELTRRNTELVKITFDNGESLRCTPDHRIMLRTGEYKQAQDLKADDSLMPLYRQTKVYWKKNDYEQVYNPSSNSFEFTHKLFAQYVFGKYRGIIHHKNCNRFDNCPTNFQICKDGKEHAHLHRELVRANREKIRLGLLRYWEAARHDPTVMEHLIAVRRDSHSTKEYKIEASKRTKELRSGLSLERKTEWDKNVKKNWSKEFVDNIGNFSELCKDKEWVMQRRYKWELAGGLEKQKEGIASYWTADRRTEYGNMVSGRRKNASDADKFNHNRNMVIALLEGGKKKIKKETLIRYNIPINHKVSKVEFLSEKEDTYDLMNVGDNHNFAIGFNDGSGIFIHNSLPMELWTFGQITGNPETDIIPDENTLATLQDMISQAKFTPPFSIVYTPLLKYQEVGLTTKLLNIEADMNQIIEAIMVGMGINKNLLLAEGPSFSSNRTMSLHALIMEMQVDLNRWERWMKNFVFYPIARKNGLKKVSGDETKWMVPEIEWEKSMDVEKADKDREMYYKLWDKGALSTYTLYSKFPELDYKAEQKKLEEEKNSIWDSHNRLPATVTKKSEGVAGIDSSEAAPEKPVPPVKPEAPERPTKEETT